MSIVYSITALSLQTASTAMRRFDHAPFFSMQKSEYTIPFYVKVLTTSISRTDKYIVLLEWSLTRGSWGKDKVVDRPKQVAESSWQHDIFHFPRQRRGWWESITTDDGLPPPEVLTYDEYTFQFLGLENEEERNGTVESGKSATTNMKSPGGDPFLQSCFLILILLFQSFWNALAN